MKERALPGPAFWWTLGAIAFGVIVRLVLLPGRGFPDDISAFEDWALALGTSGTAGFYADASGLRYPVLDYPPGYMYVLLAVGRLYVLVSHGTAHTIWLKALEKLPAVLADFGVAFVAYDLARSITTLRNARIVLIAVITLPPLWIVSAYWGQVDSVAVFAMLLTLWAALRRRWILMWALFACTILIKPQAAPLAPLLLIWEVRTAGWTAAFPAGIGVAAVIAYLATVPFTSDRGAIASARWLLERYVNGVNKYPNNTTGGFTLFGVTGSYFQSDAQRVLGVPLHTWGIALFSALLVAVAVRLWRALGNDASKIQFLAAVYVTLAGIFVLSTRMHERYLMPALAVGAVVALCDRRYAFATIALATTFTINCAFILRGFYGGAHHPVTLLVAHALSALNVASLIVITATFLIARDVRSRVLAAALGATVPAALLLAAVMHSDYALANTVIAVREMKGAVAGLMYSMTANRGGASAATLTVTPGGPGGLENGLEYAASFRPYGASSVWNRRISEHPAIASYSSAVVAHQFPSGKNDGTFRSTEPGKWDYGHPIFYASVSDPLVNTRCNQFCGTFPPQIHIPAKARPAGGSDAHFDVVQPDGAEISMWATYGTPGRDWQSGDTVTAGNISNCGSFFTGPGTISDGPGPTAGGACLRAGQITAAELLAGHIEHALFAGGACAQGRQYPANPGASTHPCTSGVGPPLGAREWYDVPCAQTQADSRLRPWEKAILCALHDYGAYMEDSGGGGQPYFVGIGVQGTESTEAALDYGQSDPFAALASQGWISIGIPDADKHGNARLRWAGADVWNPPGVDFRQHIHWLAPCSAQGTC